MVSYQWNNKQISQENSSTTTISPSIFNSHFSTLAETLAQSSGFTSDNFVPTHWKISAIKNKQTKNT